jgi:PIN domain nuclease of toxin-antitoxin system
MRLLLDTHVFLWFISGDARLPTDWRESIRDADNAVYLSVVSLWEALVKYRLGKLPLPHPPESLSSGPAGTASDGQLVS